MNDGGPAFPCELQHTENRDGRWVDRWIPEGGMSLRDYFAGQALISVYDRGGRYGPDGMTQVAKYAYEMADAMLKAREAK